MVIMWSIVSVALLAVVSVRSQETDTPSVTTSQGTVQGFRATDGDYFTFHGIPYADSTSGAHRFKAPRPAPTFEDTFVANRQGIRCVRGVRRPGVLYEGTEDCLVVDIYTSNLNSAERQPVMVWIKGKQLDHDEEHVLSFRHLVEKDVVVVSLNFREDILGFLCLGTDTAPGNAGLKDIIAGLNWVRENIENFGGDPNSVTLFGHGSGAAAVDLVTLSPLSSGLVHRAIAQSGTAMAPWAVTRDNLEYAVQIAEALGHVITDIETLSEIFTRTSLNALMSVINDLDLTDNALAFAPCLEKTGLTYPAFMSMSPHQMVTTGTYNAIPFMIGYVDEEGTIRSEELLQDEWLDKMEESFSSFLQSDLGFETIAEREDVSNQIRSFYFSNSEIDIAMINSYLRYHGETMVLVSALREARMRSATSTQPVYVYQFSYKGNLGAQFEGPITTTTAAHSEELGYIFRNINAVEPPAFDITISDILIERWTNFAKTGNPTSETSAAEWEPFRSTQTNYLRILNSNEIVNQVYELELLNPHPETVAFWDRIYSEHFLDARASWEIEVREEEEEEEAPVTTENPDNGGVGVDEGDSTEITTEAPEEEEEDVPDSASTAASCTIVIVTLFTLLSKFHEWQISS